MSRLDETPKLLALQDQKLSFEQLRIWLDNICNNVAIKYGLLTPSGKPRKAFVLDTLLKYSCRGCIRKALQHPEADDRADALYVQNHLLAVGLLVEALRQTFEAGCLNLEIEQEVDGVFGRPDVTVKPTMTGVLVEIEDLEIIIEVKTGRGFSYSQLIRYWLERPNSICVIWRVIPNQVLVIDPNKHHSILELCLIAAIRRGIDILNSKNEECRHNPTRSMGTCIVDAQNVLDSYFDSMQKSLPKIVRTVRQIVQHHLHAKPVR
ncbi:MAG: hypothetical protein QW660_08650 [Candidatus Bathyarchaeia archaeon]|nr:hypothetical protein [Candidatus Bathyarchaeota archaeon]